jgi:DNA-binding CsgD family transcriptional regulator
VLLRLNFSSKEIASLMGISPKSAEIARYRLRKKLNLKQGESLTQFIHNL